MDDIEKKVADYRQQLLDSIPREYIEGQQIGADRQPTLTYARETAVQLYRLGLLLEKVIERLADKA